MDMESGQASRAKGMALNTFREIGRIYLSKYPEFTRPITGQQLGGKGVWACSPAARGENRSRWQGRRELEGYYCIDKGLEKLELQRLRFRQNSHESERKC
jgi:hypothetical protein